MKKYFGAVEAYAANPTPEQQTVVQEHMAAAYSKIDKAVKCGVLHRNNGARKKSRLAKRLKQYETAKAEGWRIKAEGKREKEHFSRGAGEEMKN